MATNKILIYRGQESNLPTLDVGRAAFTTDSHKFFIGSASGNVEIGAGKLPFWDATVAPSGGDYTSIASACSSESDGAVIAIAPGTYTETANVSIKDGQKLFAIAGTTCASDSFAPVIIDVGNYKFTVTSVYNVIISGLKIKGNPTSNHEIFRVQNISESILKDIYIEQEGSTVTDVGIFNIPSSATTTEDCIFSNISVKGNGNTGKLFNIQDVGKCIFNNIRGINACVEDGECIYVDGCHGNTFNGIVLSGFQAVSTPKNAIELHTSRNNTFNDVYIYGLDRVNNGMFIPDYNTVNGLYVENCNGGVECRSGSDDEPLIIDNFRIEECTKVGINVRQGSTRYFTNGVIEGCGDGGDDYNNAGIGCGWSSNIIINNVTINNTVSGTKDIHLSDDCDYVKMVNCDFDGDSYINCPSTRIVNTDISGTLELDTSANTEMVSVTYGTLTDNGDFTRQCTFAHVTDSDPTVDDDANDGFVAGDWWLNSNTDKIFNLIDETVGSADWKQVYPSSTDLSGHNVTELDDVSDAGSGQIITSTERTNIGNNTTHSAGDGSDHADVASNTTHRGSTDNPHSTDLGNIGSGTLAELNSAISDATVKDKDYIDSVAIQNIIKNGMFAYDSWFGAASFNQDDGNEEIAYGGWKVLSSGTAPSGTVNRVAPLQGGSGIDISEGSTHDGKIGVYQAIEHLPRRQHNSYLKFVINVSSISTTGDSVAKIEISDSTGTLTTQSVSSTGLAVVEAQMNASSTSGNVTVRIYIEGDGSTGSDSIEISGCMLLISSVDFDFNASSFGGASLDNFSVLMDSIPTPVQAGDPVNKSYSDKNFTPVQNIAINGLFDYDSWVNTSVTSGDRLVPMQGWDTYPEAGGHNGTVSRQSTHESGAGSIARIDLDPFNSSNDLGFEQQINNLNSKSNNSYVKFVVNIVSITLNGSVSCTIEAKDGDGTKYTKDVTSTGIKVLSFQIPQSTSSEEVTFRIYLTGDSSNNGTVDVGGVMILNSEKDFNYDETSFASLAMSPHDALINNVPDPVQDGDPVSKSYADTKFPYQKYDRVSVTSAQSDVKFTGLSAGTYKIIIKNAIPATDSVDLRILVSDDNGSTWKTSSYRCLVTISRQGHNPFTTHITSYIPLTRPDANEVGSDTDEDGYSGEVTMYNINDGSYDFHVNADGVYESDASSAPRLISMGGYYNGTDIDAVKIMFESGNIESGEFILRKID